MYLAAPFGRRRPPQRQPCGSRWTASGVRDVLWHADAFVCSAQVHDSSHYPPPILLKFSAAPYTVLIGFSGPYPQTCCTPNRRSNPIAHRVRRKHQRLPPSLLIENASDRVPLRRESVLPEAFPIKPSDNPGTISPCDLGTRCLTATTCKACASSPGGQEQRNFGPIGPPYGSIIRAWHPCGYFYLF